MNLPNKLTILRILLIPVFLFFFFATSLPHNFLVAFVVFTFASLTDMLDGQIARKNNQITNFGKLMDPLADKLLVTSAMVCLLSTGYKVLLPFNFYQNHYANISTIVLIIMLSRDLVVNSIRLVAAGEGVVIAADKWGKLKTISQMIWLSMSLLRLEHITSMDNGNFFLQLPNVVSTGYYIIETALFIIMTVLTVASGMNYTIKNRKMFGDA